MSESRALDEYFLALSGSEHIDLIRSAIFALGIVGALGFLYYWIRCLGVVLIDIRRLHKSRQSIFKFNDFSNPGTQRFLRFFRKAALVWLIAGWPLVLLATGLVSEDALNAFYGYHAVHS